MRNDTTAAKAARILIEAGATALKNRIEDVNRLNVFPVPDGDTGTNMSLTMDTVVRELNALVPSATLDEVLHAVTHGSLMGARGNSGVILSQILRGLCEGVDLEAPVDSAQLAGALERSVSVAFQAVRKPVEGTMLTVLKDAAAAGTAAASQRLEIEAALESVTQEAFASVNRTPELLPVLKENGVVDAGGLGLALLFEGFSIAALGHELSREAVLSTAETSMQVVPVDDWDDEEYLYCTEFLLFGERIDKPALEDFLALSGGSELLVGAGGEYKVHVHTNDPGSVLTKMTALGEVAEVHINNMRRQQAVRDEKLRAESPGPRSIERKPVGFVAVASGEGLADILRSLGVDVVVSGGQTMNPSTEDLLAAIDSVPAHEVIVLPNNKNIVMAAGAAASVAKVPTHVVPTRSVPAAFSALLAFDPSSSVSQTAQDMAEAAAAVHTGEVTVAVKDAVGKTGPIKAGQVIGIVDDEEIVVVGEEVVDVAAALAASLAEHDPETITLFAGADLDDTALQDLSERVAARFPNLEVETHRGNQPLYPVIMSAE